MISHKLFSYLEALKTIIGEIYDLFHMMTQIYLEAGVKGGKVLLAMTSYRLVSHFQATGAIIREIKGLFYSEPTLT